MACRCRHPLSYDQLVARVLAETGGRVTRRARWRGYTIVAAPGGVWCVGRDGIVTDMSLRC